MNKNNIKTEWDLETFFKDIVTNKEGTLKETEKESYKFINKWKDREDYLTQPKILKEALDEYEIWEEKYSTDGSVGYYFALKSVLEQDNSHLKAENTKIRDFALKIYSDVQFFEHRIAKIPKEKQDMFLQYKGLEPYKHMLEMLFNEAKYLLGEEVEKVLAIKSASAYSMWVQMTEEFISSEEAKVLTDKGEREIKTVPEIIKLFYSNKKPVRDDAAKALNKILKQNLRVAEYELNAVLENKKTNDELRKISRPDLTRLIGDDMEPSIVDTLISSVQGSYPLAHDYYKLKAKLLGVEKLEYHERYVEFDDSSRKYAFSEAVKIAFDTLNDLAPEFGDIFNRYLETGQIDVYPKKGKMGGAFCIHNLKSQPSFVMLNFSGVLTDITTITHEMGHAINSEFIKRNENSLNQASPKATAEVASTFTEDFVFEKLRKDMNEEEQLWLLLKKLDSDISSIHRQISCYTFEQELHQTYRKAGYLDSKKIGEIFTKHMQAYMGPYVIQSKGSENWWVYWSHIRTYFYTYSYASGLLISKAMQNQYKKDKDFIKHVKTFMSTGSSLSPKDIFLEMGIDITKKEFWDSGLSEVETLLNHTKKLAKKLGKI